MIKLHKPIGIETLLKALSYLIALTALLSVFQNLGSIYKVIALILGGFSLYTDFISKRFIKRSLINLLSVLVIVASFYRINLEDPATPLIEGLTLLIFIKFMEQKAFRDYMQIYAIALFMLAGSALFNIDISFIAYFFVLLFLVAIAIVALTFYSEDSGLVFEPKATVKILLTALMIPLISLPMMTLLFIVLPRTNYPLFSFLNRPVTGLTGFTDNVRLGDVTDIQSDSSIIFRVSMKPIDETMLYWRGAILDYFNGQAWSKSKGARGDRINPSMLEGEVITQSIFLEAYENSYLFALDRPYYINLKDAKIRGDMTISLEGPVSRRIRYEVYSKASSRVIPLQIDREKYLQLPDRISQEVKDLALSLGYNKDGLTTVSNVIRHLNSSPFKYSLQRLPVTENPIEDFLFKYPYGNCEYYASAAAVLLRLNGIPARLVVGYRGGIYNPLAAYYMVSQQSAHVWVEAFVKDSWLRIDPTPGASASVQGTKTLLFTLRLYADTINYYWNQMVISYNFERQIRGVIGIQSFFKSLRQSDLKQFKQLALNISALALIVFLLIAISYVIKNRKSLEHRLVGRYEKRLFKRGYKRLDNEGLREFTMRIEDKELRKRALLFVDALESLYYKDKRIDRSEAKRLIGLIDSL